MLKKIGNRYEILQKIGEGGMGIVYKARDLVLQRIVAIKMLHPTLCNEAKLKTRFQIEAVITAGLEHPSIVTLYDFVAENDNYYIVMQFLEGKTCEDLIKEEGFIPCQRLIPIMCDVMDALAYAHRKGIIHRDIKPSNIMITTSGQLKIMDFGIARMMDSPHLTMTGVTPGSVLYMPPEQIQNEEVDHRSDIYSLGITLFQMATGKAPFAGPNLSQFEILKRHIAAELPSPRAMNPEVSEQLESVIKKATMKRPEDRFQTMEEFRMALTASATGATRIRSYSPGKPLSEEEKKSRGAPFEPTGGQKQGLLRDLLSRKESRVLIFVLTASLLLAVGLVAPKLWERYYKRYHKQTVTPIPVQPPLSPQEPKTSEIEPTSPEDIFRFNAYYFTKSRGESELRDAETLMLEDRYYVTVALKDEAYIYIAQIDSAGTIAPIFPNEQFSTMRNPLGPGLYRLPEEKKFFFLTGGPGREHLYVIVLKDRNDELESIYNKLTYADISSIKRLAVEFRDIFEQQDPINIKEIWFWHK